MSPTLTPTTTAVLVIDMQNDTVHAEGASAISGAVEHARSQGVVGNVAKVADGLATRS